MEIKNVRKPTEKEKKDIIPKLTVIGITTAIITLLIYFMEFYRFDIGESMHIVEKFWTSKSNAQHNLLISFFEELYGRDYMLNKLEGLPVSALVAVVFEAFCGVVYKGYTFFHEDKKIL